jgi:hypothetical protein
MNLVMDAEARDLCREGKYDDAALKMAQTFAGDRGLLLSYRHKDDLTAVPGIVGNLHLCSRGCTFDSEIGPVFCWFLTNKSSKKYLTAIFQIGRCGEHKVFGYRFTTNPEPARPTNVK